MKFADFHNTKLAEASKTRNPTRDYLRNNPVSPDQMAKPVKQMSVPELATVSDEALDNAYHYGRSTPGNTFGWQANLKSAAYAKQMIDKGVTDIEQISDAIHKGWNVTARAFVQNPDQFDDTEKLKAAGKLEAKLQQRAKLMNIEYAQLPDDEQEKDRVVARALLQAIKGQQGVAEASNTMQRYGQLILKRAKAKREAEAREKAEQEKAEQEKANKEKKPGVAEGSLNELSTDALSSYGKKAEKSARRNAELSVKHQEKAFDKYNKGGASADRSWDDQEKAEKYAAISDKRNAGANLAAAKLAKKFSKGVAEAKADPLGAWIAHKNGTEARKFKTREGAKKYVASHEGFTVSSSEAFHDTYRKKKVQEVKKFRTTYGWAGGSKEPRSAHAKQVAAKRKEYEKGLGKFEPTDNMVGTAKIIKDIAMSDASPEHKKAAIDALNKKGVAEEYNPEYDDEAGMADNNLSTLRRAVDGLDDLIDTGDNLPEWCQEKIAVAKSMLVTVWNYMESEDDVMAEGEKWIQKAVNPKTKGDLHNALHVPQDETIPKSRIAQAIHSADPHLRHMAQFAKNVAKEDAGGMGTGSVATSMGAGNGFANGGPGTITRRRK